MVAQMRESIPSLYPRHNCIVNIANGFQFCVRQAKLMTVMAKVLGKILVGQEEIQRRTAELGRQISLDYSGSSVTLVAILKGSFVSGRRHPANQSGNSGGSGLHVGVELWNWHDIVRNDRY